MNKKLSYFTTIRFLSRYISRHKYNFIMFYFGWLVDMILSVSMPILFGVMINEIVYYQNVPVFVKVSLVFVVMSIFSCVLYFFVYAQHHYLMSRYVFDIKMDVFSYIQNCEAQYLSGASSGDMVTTIQNYSAECMNFIVRNVIHTSNHILTLLAVTAYLFVIHWQIGVLLVFLAPVSVWVNAKFGKRMRSYGDMQRASYGSYISWVYEILSGLGNIRMLEAEHKVKRDFVKRNKELFDINIKSGLLNLTAGNIITFTSLAMQLVIFVFIGYESVNLNITVGEFIVIMTFYGMLTEKVKILSESYLNAQSRISSIQRIHDVMESPTEDDWGGKNELTVSKGNIKFRDIEFSYEKSNTVLEGFSLAIEPGERCAIVGESGSGKTTLAYMMAGFYKPQSGHIEIDGQRLSECSLKSIRRNVGIIQQDVLLFEGTIKENIMLGNRMAHDDEIISACRRAGIWEFINGLAEGLDTAVGKNGVGLSGGQKQRIAIARIYLKDPKIIIFDEATSSLDTETEEQIHESWKNVLEGRTSIVIAHRQSSVMLCDRVALMDGGKICETGTPSHMLENSLAFKTLFNVTENNP